MDSACRSMRTRILSVCQEPSLPITKNRPPFHRSLNLSRAGAGETAAGPGALQTRSSFVDPRRTASHFPAVQASHSLGSFVVIRHFHKCETARASGFAIVDHGNVLNLAEGREEVSQIGFRGFETQVADINALHSIFLPKEFASLRQKRLCRQSFSMRAGHRPCRHVLRARAGEE